MMKKKIISSFALLITIVLLFSGCNLKLYTIDELIVQPRAFGENEQIRAVISDYLQGSPYTLKNPSRGDLRSAVTVNDIVNDGTTQAIAFYQLNSQPNFVNMMLLEYRNDTWRSVQNIEGQGSNVSSLEFVDLNNDGIKEIITCWDIFNNKEKHILTSYRYDVSKKAAPLTPIGENLSFSENTVLDIDDDGSDDILLFNISSSKDTKNASATLYKYNAEKSELVMSDTVALDGNVTTYANIFTEKNADNTVIYIDGYKGDSFMVTETVVWDTTSQLLKAPLYDANTGTTLLTSRGNRIKTRDINTDGIAEVGMDGVLMGKKSATSLLVDWAQIQGTQLKKVNSTVINLTDGYMIRLDAALSGQIAASYNEDSHTWIISQWDFTNNVMGNEICTIMAMKQSKWYDNPINGYDVLITNNDIVYVGKVSDGKNGLSLSFEYLKNNILIYQ